MTNQTPQPTTVQNKPQCKHSWIQWSPIKICYFCGYKPKQNKPQLSAEIRERFREKFTAFGNVYADMAELEAFLATALEEQKKMYVEEVEELNVQEVDTWKKGIEWNGGYESAINDVLAILNGKDANE